MVDISSTCQSLSESTPELWATSCILCGETGVNELYPARLPDRVISAHSFSARRSRSIAHYALGKCVRCGLVRSLEILPEGSSLSLYAQSEYLYSELSQYIAQTYWEIFSKAVAEAGIGKVARVLEVGCGDGAFLKRLYDEGYRAITGIDPNTTAAAAQYPEIADGLVRGTLEDADVNPGGVDVVCSFHVLDHLYRPDLFFQQCRKFLRPGGLLIIVCHDVEAWSAKLLGEQSPIFDIEHVYLFGEKTLEELAKKFGLFVSCLGQVQNRYPLSYWLRLLPMLRPAIRYLPKYFREMPIALKAGNIFLVAKVPE